MIISIRGTHGSGKSWVVRELMHECSPTPKFGKLGIRKPEAYLLQLPGIDKPLFVLGPYETDCGGCDSIQPYDLILEFIESYAAEGHVLFEGAIVSSSYGRVGRLMEKWGTDACMLFLTTPLDECIRRVNSRRKVGVSSTPSLLGDGPLMTGAVLNTKNTENKYLQIEDSKEKIRVAGIMRVVESASWTAPLAIKELLMGRLG